MYRPWVSFFLGLLAVALVLGWAGWANAQDTLTNWTGGNGNWTDPTWDNGSPTNGYDAFIGNGVTVTLDSSGNTCNSLFLGVSSNNAPGSGYVVMSGGDLASNGNINNAIIVGEAGSGTFTLNNGTITVADGVQIQVGSWGGTGTFTQNGGTINNTDAATGINGDAAVYIGAYGTGTYRLAGGTLNSPWTNIGYGGQNLSTGGLQATAGTGYFIQTGGVHNAAALTVGGGWNNGGNGTYTLSGSGQLNVGDFELAVMDGSGPGGDPLVGTFNQNGGSVTVTHQMMIGSDATNSGLYGWGSGTSGGRGDGTYNFNGGTLAGGGSMIVRYDAPATGTFQGQGAVGLTGTLTNNGRMIADGGLLDLSSFSAVKNTVANTAANGSTNNGWFATNGGQLKLPAIDVTGAGEYTWGADLSLVNSVQFTFAGLSPSGGTLNASLFDPANAAVPSTAGLPGDVVGVWDVTAGFSFSSLDATFRYDDVLAGSKTSYLKLYEYEGDAWVALPTMLDMTDDWASVNNVGTGFFAAAVPEPSTFILCVLGLLSLIGFRAWRKHS